MQAPNDIAALGREFDEMAGQVHEAGIQMMRLVVSTTFQMVVQNTEIWSGFAAANVRIGIGGLDDAELLSPPRPAYESAKDPGVKAIRGKYEAQITTENARELGKLDGIQFGEPVEIGTAVQYEIPGHDLTPYPMADVWTEASIVGPEIAQGLFEQS